MNKYMKRALELAVENVREGGQPFGAVLVSPEDDVAAEGVNELHRKYDVTGHAELIAIRKAQEKLQTHDLSEFTMYASGLPCPMCLTSMYYSNIEDIYYCESIEDAKKAGLGGAGDIYEDLGKENEDRKIVMKHMPLKEALNSPMEMWVKKQSKEK